MMETLFIWALFAACITMFIDYCISPGEIFGFYGEWLGRHCEEKWAKPLGLCPVCMGTWIGIIIGLMLIIMGKLIWYMILPFLAVEVVIIRLLMRYG